MISRRTVMAGLAAAATAPIMGATIGVGQAAGNPSLPIHFRSASALAKAIRRREISAVELLELYIERLERFDPTLNAVVVRDIENARTRAKAADDALARGDNWGPLHGVAMTVKESFGVAGLPTTAGAPMLKDNRPTENATATQRLIDAGAIIFGKTNVPIWLNDFQSYNEIYGSTNNPWNTEYTPGGSSGGAAAALAAGLTGLELGSDLGGSIRLPAHFCGVYGHKPSFGLVPRRGQVPPLPGTLAKKDLSVAGPLARHPDDLDLALGVLAGPDNREATAWKLALPAPRRRSLDEYRVAAWLDDPAYPADREMVTILRQTVADLRAAGVTVNEAARPGFSLDESHEIYYAIIGAVYARSTPDDKFQTYLGWVEDWAAPGNDSNDARFIRGVVQRFRDWTHTREERERLRGLWAGFFRDYDVLLCPVTLGPAFPHDQSEPPFERPLMINGEKRRYYDLNVWPGLATMPYLPATTAPVGVTAAGLPVGIQIIGPYLEDRTTIDFARRLAAVTGGFKSPPGY